MNHNPGTLSSLQDTTRRRDITNAALWASFVRVIYHTFVNTFRTISRVRKSWTSTLVSNDATFCFSCQNHARVKKLGVFFSTRLPQWRMTHRSVTRTLVPDGHVLIPNIEPLRTRNRDLRFGNFGFLYWIQRCYKHNSGVDFLHLFPETRVTVEFDFECKCVSPCKLVDISIAWITDNGATFVLHRFRKC